MINVYNYTYFELHSKIRNRNFRFCRYEGNNYEEIAAYIKGLSPQTQIWDKDSLRKGKYYTFSGRTFTMQEVHEWSLRACIASNPYLVLEDGIHSLSESKENAIEYLRQDSHHWVFPFESIIDSFSYDESQNKFILFNHEHPKGITIETLPDYREWYIGKDDKIYALFENVEAKYTMSAHIVTIDLGLREKADRVLDLIYEINKYSLSGNNKRCIFNPSWEDPKRYKILFHSCLKEYKFREFVSVLYNYIYEETKSTDSNGKFLNRELLPKKFKNDEFVIRVNELRNYYSHGVAEYRTSNVSIYEIFKFYLEVPMPRGETDYETLQAKLLDDFIDFLNRLKEYVVESSIVEGTICLDEKDNVYCGNVLLPREFAIWGGAKCVIKQKISNEITPLNNTYPFFSQFPHLIVETKGLVEVCYNDSAAMYFCDNIYLGNNLSPFCGCETIVKSMIILSQSDNEHNYFRYQATDIEISNNRESDALNYTELMYHSDEILTDSVMTRIESVNLSEISKFRLKNIGGTLRVVDIELNKNETYTSKGRIEKDANGIYHVGNVILSSKFARYYEGKTCIILTAVRTSSDSKYPFFSSKVNVLT